MDTAETTSLTDLRLGGLSSDTNSMSENLGKMNASSSMGNITEDEIGKFCVERISLCFE